MSPQKQKRELQPEQAAAAYEIKKHISVTAGPGSGKTTVLVERYLHILRQNTNLNIDQIVAITFTNRAANEMRERLREELNLILQTAAPNERRHWLNYKRTLDGAVITTIHGFCARLLREFPVEARVDPQFLLLDEHRAAMLLESVVEEVLNEFIGAGHVEISRLTLGVGRGKLAEALGQLYREVRGQGLSLTDLALRTAQSHATEDDHANAVEELSRSMDVFLGRGGLQSTGNPGVELSRAKTLLHTVYRTTPAARANQAKVSESWATLKPLLGAIPAVEELAHYCREVDGFRKLRPQARGDLKEQVQALDALVWEKELGGCVPQICLDLFAKQYALEMALMLNRIDERLNEEKQKLSALDFDDLELRTLDLLKRPEVIARAAERYKFFLVDEFQDTNGLQRQLLEQLALQKGRRESANLFIVGDRKQSIYGFRGADVAVFSEMTNTLLAAGGESKPLLLNFRSQPPLIGFFNFLFERLFQPGAEVSPQELEELGYVGHEPSEARRELRDSGPLVELMITTEASGNEDDPKAEQTSRQLDAGQLALRIISLIGPPENTGLALTRTAGVPPASSNGFTRGTAESDHPPDVAFNAGGRDTRGPSNSGPGETVPDGTESGSSNLFNQEEVESDNPNYVAFNAGGRDARGPSKSGPGETVPDGSFKYSDIALLFRAMTNVQIYESAFRRANIPYQTVLGRGFYEREEITDLIQLLRFLDNKTDELALAAVLRSPLCGISDNALLALRCAPTLDAIDLVDADPLKHFTQTRRLYRALLEHHKIAFISDEEHLLLDRAADLIKGLIARQHHYALSTLLRFAVEQSEFEPVIAATFDGAQRLANVQRLFTLAERFERSGHHLIRDFVRYVEEFEAIGSRESEGQIDEATNAVKLMTIHQAKGLEFPVVIIPDLQRWSKPPDNWVLLDRQRGLTLKVPDGRGRQAAGLTFNRFEQRHAYREQFESMRLLYVAATRAQDRLILSGTTKDMTKVGLKSDTWLNWICQSLELPPPSRSGVVALAPNVDLQLTLNLASEQVDEVPTTGESGPGEQASESADSIAETFPLLHTIEPERERAVHRFSVTQLINYQRCPRQYYFDRVLHTPAPDALAVWNDAEAAEPPANLTATLKGAVIHRFCETYTTGDSPEELLRRSFADVLRLRQAELAERLIEINPDEAIAELLFLAQNYLSSPVFERIERARMLSATSTLAGSGDRDSLRPRGQAGLWSELSFRLRRPLGILSGAIDKLLFTPSASGKGFDVEIIDFKTNRLRPRLSDRSATSDLLGPRAPSPASSSGFTQGKAESDNLRDVAFNDGGRGRPRSQKEVEQIAFDFSAPADKPRVVPQLSVDERVAITATDYQLQMQAYALAVSELAPSLLADGSRIVSTLHFLEPNVEFHLTADLLSPEACRDAIDGAMLRIVSSAEPGEFPVRTATHCRMCNFLGICPAGREFISALRRSSRG